VTKKGADLGPIDIQIPLANFPGKRRQVLSESHNVAS
jgi:hypothetical protein